MKNLPTKQIYLLSILVIGLVTISAYSTYALFSHEAATSNVVSIDTPNSLYLPTAISEYRQVTIPKNSYTTTDVDIYNNHDYEACYSVWYKILDIGNTDSTKVKVYEITTTGISSSGTVAANTSKRIHLIITNDNEYDSKVNIGVVNTVKNDTCSFDIGDNVNQITKTISEPKKLANYIVSTNNKNTDEEGYITYKDNKKIIDLSNDSKLNISNEFTYHDEVFTLNNPQEIKLEDLSKYESNETTKYYTCLNTNSCQKLIQINKTSVTEKKEVIEGNEETIKYYHITEYDTLHGYVAGESGLRKIDNKYYFYGDNPHNYIYYNCTNEFDTKTCELWRILSFTYDESSNEYTTKIIRDESLGMYKFSDNSQEFIKSDIYKYLTNDYKLKNTNYIKEFTFKQENIPDLKIDLKDIKTIDTKEELKSKITIMNLSDYLNASVCENKKLNEYDTNCLKANWLTKITDTPEWTMTANTQEKYIDSETEEEVIPKNDSLYVIGKDIDLWTYDSKLNIRPIVNLSGRVFTTTGNGTIENPYVIR